MLGQQFATILARTDPFDVAQGVERYIRSLTGEQVRFVILAARSQMNEWYRDEFVPLLDEQDDERLKSAFAHTLKSNLRAIPLFGATFCEGVISQVPADRTIALGEERRTLPPFRPGAFAIIAIVLLVCVAAAQHVWSAARATAETPSVIITPVPIAAETPVPPPTARPATPRAIAAAPATATPAPATATPAPATAVPAPAPVERAARVAAPHRTPPPGRGVKTVIAAATPAPTPKDVDVTDMPQAYSDATPLPKYEAPASADVSTEASVPTPTPGPNRSWTHRLVHAGVHLVNSTLTTIGVGKKAAQPTPASSPPGPQPR